MARTQTQTVYWREEFNAELPGLVARKLSARNIAAYYNQRYGLNMSRNVIIGQCHRQKLKLLGGSACSSVSRVLWSAEELSTIRHLASNDVSAKQIAVQLRRPRHQVQAKLIEMGIARDAVFRSDGRRLNLPGDAPRQKRSKAAPKPEPFRFSNTPVAPKPIRMRPITADAIPFMERTGMQCAFILGDYRIQPAMCCGQDVAWRTNGTPTSWCATHLKLVYTASQPAHEPANESRRMQARAFG